MAGLAELDVLEAEGAAFEGFVHAEWHPADPGAGPYETGCPYG